MRALRVAERRRPLSQRVPVLSSGERGVGRELRGRGRDRAGHVSRKLAVTATCDDSMLEVRADRRPIRDRAARVQTPGRAARVQTRGRPARVQNRGRHKAEPRTFRHETVRWSNDSRR